MSTPDYIDFLIDSYGKAWGINRTDTCFSGTCEELNLFAEADTITDLKDVIEEIIEEFYRDVYDESEEEEF